jgi:Ca-activated chloride channel family protein
MMHFARPEYLWYLLCLLPAALLAGVYLRWRKSRLERIAQPALLSRLFPGKLKTEYLLRMSIFGLAAVLTIIGLANLQYGGRMEKGHKLGLDIVFAIDVSRSMDAKDLAPSRMERAKQLAILLTEKLPANRIGLVAFAGNAYIQSPLTADHSAIRLLLNSLSSDMLSTQGTAIGEALGKCSQLLQPANESGSPIKTSSTVVILISDGEDHDESTPDEVAELKKDGIAVHAIGVGKAEGAPIPLYEEGAEVGTLRDEQGEVVISKPDEELLSGIAHATGGNYYRLTEEDKLMQALAANLQGLQKTEQEFQLNVGAESRFQWFIGAGLALFLLEYLLSIRKRNIMTEKDTKLV